MIIPSALTTLLPAEWLHLYKPTLVTIADQILDFLFHLRLDLPVTDGIEVMNPFQDAEAKRIVETFYHRFYSDKEKRCMIIGINPGRFGGGITGIPFTDPIRLQSNCGIENNWTKKQELSSIFIYDVIDALGGAAAFYKQFYITAVSPLGFTRESKNLNYYDDKNLQRDIKPFAVDCMQKQLRFGINTNVAFCLGDGKNYKYVAALNKEMKFFNEIIPLPHPRFIMQYKLKSKSDYITYYTSRLMKCCS